jgi:hypothetical protein
MSSTVLDATRREFLAIMAAAGLLPACATADRPAAPATRTVHHPLGTFQGYGCVLDTLVDQWTALGSR